MNPERKIRISEAEGQYIPSGEHLAEINEACDRFFAKRRMINQASIEYRFGARRKIKPTQNHDDSRNL